MSFFTALISSKIALAALGVAAVAVGGTAAVAATGNLPEASQGIVHTASAMPDPTASATAETADSTEAPNPSSTPKGPDATGSAAFGLCNAFAQVDRIQIVAHCGFGCGEYRCVLRHGHRCQKVRLTSLDRDFIEVEGRDFGV
jgi:hypothetical protein